MRMHGKSSGAAPAGRRAKAGTLALAAMLLVFHAMAGCSSPTSSKGPKTACNCEKDGGGGSVVKQLTGTDSLVKTAKTQGKGVINGAVNGESKSDVVKGLLKMGRNAAGEARLLASQDVPLSGATVLIFDALQNTTAAETTLTTDRNGNYAAILEPGKYFGFVVHLDLQTFRLVTASIPFMAVVKDTLATMDTAVAIEDNTGPTVAAVHDATSPEAGVFLVSPLASTGAKLNIVFSEPMQRESARGILLGKVNTANVNGSLVLKDTLPSASVTPSWSGDSKVLTLTLGRLEAGARYGIILPTTLKDLGKNPLEKEYRAAFDAVPEAQVADQPFQVASTFPLEKEALKPSQNPHIAFSRPPQLQSALRHIVMSPETEGYWELNGARLVFIHKEPLKVGVTYEVLVPDSVTDVSGKRLAKAHRWSFAVRDYDGAAKDKSGVDRQVALQVEDFFSAYLQGDVGRIAGMLGQTFRLEADGQILSGQQFIDRIRREGADKARLSAGFLGPVYRTAAATCSTRTALWKVASQDKRDTLWVQTRTVPGILPRVLRGNVEVTSGISWSKTDSRFTLDGRAYVYDLPPSAAGTSDQGQADPRYHGERLRQATTVVLEPVQDLIRDQFSIDGGISVTDLTAKVAVKLSTAVKRGRKDWDPALACSDAPAADTSYRIVKFILGSDGSKWLFTHASDGGEVEKKTFAATVSASDFKVREMKPIVLAAPVNGASGVADGEGKITFRFKGLDLDSVGGYLAGLAEDPKFIGGRAPRGGLYFVRNQGRGGDHAFVLSAKAEAVTGATAILREVQTLGLPGWERTGFKYPLAELFNPQAGLAGVYQWKVIAVRDTSASQFLASGFSPDRFYGESDFGPNIGAFAARGYPTAGDLKAIETAASAPVTAAVEATAFSDRDLDGFPDPMELNYRTNPDDKGLFPNFTVDTDQDGLADFLEILVDASKVEEPADRAAVDAFFKALAAKGVKWTDSDADGFPDDVEKLLGYNPADASSRPATRARVPAPAGVFAGLLKLGESAYPVKFKVREQDGSLLVSYSAALKDTLIDSVRAALNEAMGEFLFPIRLPDNGPDSGRSLLLRGTYDKNRAFLGGAVNKVASVARTSSAFGGGPFVGQYAASGRGEDVSGYLGVSAAGSPTTPATPVVSPTQPVFGAVLSYRKPPFGVGEHARFRLRQGAGRWLHLVMLDEFGDTVAVLDSTNSFPQEDGSYDLNARKIRSSSQLQYTRRVQMDGRLGRGKDSTVDIWVLDGSVTVSLDSCRRIEAGVCKDRYYRDVAGQFSLKVPSGHSSVKALANGIAGDFAGWLQQDKFGTGLSTGTGTGEGTGTGTGGTGGTPVEPAPVTTFAKPFQGTGEKFRTYVTQAGIGPSEVFYVSLLGRVMRTQNDSLHIKDAPFPHCGNVSIKATPIPLLDGATAQERAAFSRDSAFVSGGKYAVLAIDDDAQPGTPARLAKARDALGFVRTEVFLIEARYLDPSAFVGDRCIDGGLPPPSPLDAGLPALPTGAAYFRGDLEILRSALSGAGWKVSLTPPGAATTTVAELNPATLRIDPDTRAAMAADLDDPSKGYVLLGSTGQAGTPRMVEGRPSALVK